MSDHWSCRPELYILGTGPLCIHNHVSKYLTAASDAAEAEQQMVEAEYDAAAAAARAGIAESNREAASNALRETVVQMLPVGIAIGTVGLGFVGYMWWRSRNR